MVLCSKDIVDDLQSMNFSSRLFFPFYVFFAASASSRLISFLAFFLPFTFLISGCRKDMHDQPKYQPLEASNFFVDGRASRQLVPGTVARGHLNEDAHLYTGKSGNSFVDSFPFPVTLAVLQRGQERFNIFCTPCHGRLGNGEGMVVRRGFRHPPSYHIDRLRKAPVGYYFDVISKGFGAMQDYAAQVAVRDRWAIVAYIRALQLSQHATLADIPAEERSKLGEHRP